MSFKGILLLFLTFIIIVGLTAVGYFFIDRRSKEKLAELERESQTIGQAGGSGPSTKPREIILPDQPKGEKKSSFYLQADKGSYAVGEAFNLRVRVKAKGEVVDGAEFILNYDPEIVDINQVTTGSFFSLYPQKQIDKEKGIVRIVALQSPDESKKLNEETVATLSIRGRKKGQAEFSFLEQKSHIAAYGGQDLLEQTQGLSIKIK